MRAVFIELPAFMGQRESYLPDPEFLVMQELLMRAPELGAVIEGTGGLRKLRVGDARRGKGKRGGLRVIYYHWVDHDQFWLFAVYDKNAMEDLTTVQRATLKGWLKGELRARRCN